MIICETLNFILCIIYIILTVQVEYNVHCNDLHNGVHIIIMYSMLNIANAQGWISSHILLGSFSIGFS